MSAPEYAVARLADLVNIPDEALPRFYAELPKMVVALKSVRDAAPALAVAAKGRAPWPLKWLPISVFEAMFLYAGQRNLTWIDDDEGTVSLRARASAGGEVFYSRAEKMEDPA